MHIRYCPRCGHKVLPNAKFCGNCGYRFDTNTNNSSNHINNTNTRPTRRTVNPYNNRTQLHREAYVPPKSHHSSHKLLIIIVIIILCIGGYFGYQSFTSGGSNNSPATKTQTKGIPEKTAGDNLGSVWQNVSEEVNYGDDTSMYDYFTSKSSNSNYRQLNSWARNMHKATSINSIDFDTNIKSITPISSNESKVKYIVNYTFHNKGTKNRKQSFIWHATFKKINGNWLISHNGSDAKPISNTTF